MIYKWDMSNYWIYDIPDVHTGKGISRMSGARLKEHKRTSR